MKIQVHSKTEGVLWEGNETEHNDLTVHILSEVSNKPIARFNRMGKRILINVSPGFYAGLTETPFELGDEIAIAPLGGDIKDNLKDMLIRFTKEHDAKYSEILQERANAKKAD